jgi:hypothetical protein
MLKKTLLLILCLFISSCGYEAMHSKKNITKYDFSINRINFKGDRDFNLKMKEKLNIYGLEKKNKDFELEIETISKKTIFAKNVSGDPISFDNTIRVTISILANNIKKRTIIINKNFNYNNNKDKYSLKEYEKEIKNNLAGAAAQELILKLSNIQ